VTRYLLDTNIVSNLAKPQRSAALIGWLFEQASEDLFIASYTIGEIRRGILIMPQGNRRGLLERWFDGAEGPRKLFAGRILPFDEAASLIWAELMAHGKSSGRPRSLQDMIIGATALANDCVIVTDNERDFFGFKLLNPMRMP
jgi:predicted nucleic acid-binding protein